MEEKSWVAEAGRTRRRCGRWAILERPTRRRWIRGELEERRDTLAKLRELNGKAQDGDEGAALEIRKVLDGSPDLTWRFIEGPAKMAQTSMLNQITKDDDLTSKELLEHQLESMKMEVAGKDPSPLERLLAERVVATWLQVQLFEGLCAVGLKGEIMRQGEHRQEA